MNNSLLTGI